MAVLLVLSSACAVCPSIEASAARPNRDNAPPAAAPRLEDRLHQLSARLDGTLAQYTNATANFQSTIATFSDVIHLGEKAGDTFALARDDWEAARRGWEQATVLIEVAAMVDAINLDQSRTVARGAGTLDCADGMTTAAFRIFLADRGVPLVGKEVHHIVPRSLGGADHPANYKLIPRQLNRELSNHWGTEQCRLFRSRCAEAITVSRKCGSYTGPSY